MKPRFENINNNIKVDAKSIKILNNKGIAARKYKRKAMEDENVIDMILISMAMFC
jgi:hypothetical protein